MPTVSFDELRRAATSEADPWPGPANRIVCASVPSTNSLARRIAAEYLEEEQKPPSFLLLAIEQTRGRGRGGRVWESPAGGVYASLLCHAEDRAALATLPLLAAVGVAHGLVPHLPAGAWEAPGSGIKWPNDLLVGGRKIGGVLIEAVRAGSDGGVAVVGFGVNHGAAGSPAPLPWATSLALLREEAERRGAGEAAAVPGLGRLARDLVAAVDAELAHAGDPAYAVDAYRSLSIHSPGDEITCRLAGELVRGTFRGFDERGFLALDTPSGERRLATGEVVEG